MRCFEKHGMPAKLKVYEDRLRKVNGIGRRRVVQGMLKLRRKPAGMKR
jgi:hypothetical protein